MASTFNSTTAFSTAQTNPKHPLKKAEKALAEKGVPATSSPRKTVAEKADSFQKQGTVEAPTPEAKKPNAWVLPVLGSVSGLVLASITFFCR